MKDGDKFLQELREKAQVRNRKLQELSVALAFPTTDKDAFYWLDYLRVNKN
ncbi:MAG: hypothetical protein JRE40_15135 [Deltaproteobacteria bacterium]|nr:hypothetical protein [Deltaproteobacteria bacterium]